MIELDQLLRRRVARQAGSFANEGRLESILGGCQLAQQRFQLAQRLGELGAGAFLGCADDRFRGLGDMIEVDGDAGTVKILERAGG